MRLLDLFCGAGGAGMGYHRAGFEVVGVDINPQPNYPFTFFQGDALEFLDKWNRDAFWPDEMADEIGLFDAIHASPPCQGYTELNNDKSNHPLLIGPMRRLLEASGVPYVIENVAGARDCMVDPIELQGSHFGLHVQRKRLFETNWPLTAPTQKQEREQKFLVYEHGAWRWTQNVPVYGTGGRKAYDYWPFAMGVGENWDECWMTREELAEAIPPAYTEYIGAQLLEHIAEESVAACG